MAITISELAELARQAGLNLKVVPEDNLVVGNWSTERFRDAEGDSGIVIFVILGEDGEFISFVAPSIYSLKGCEHRAAAIEAMTRVAYVTPYVGYELDPEEDRVRATIEFPLETGTLTSEQLKLSTGMLAAIVDHFDPVIRHAMTAGEVDLSLAEQDPPAERDELEELVAKLGGIEKLRELAAARSGTQASG